MRVKILLFLCYFFACAIATAANINTADIDATQLIEVDAKNKIPCIEYFKVAKKLYCSTQPLLNTKISKEIADAEVFQLHLNTNNWKVAWTDIKPDMTTIEYLPHGQSVKDWQQMITTQFMANIPADITPKMLAQQFIKNLQQQGFNPAITYHQESRNNVIFEFQIINPSEHAQDEIQKIVKTTKGIYLLHYVIRKDNMDEKARNEWLEFIKTRELK